LLLYDGVLNQKILGCPHEKRYINRKKNTNELENVEKPENGREEGS
jgi:hypothetical protein